MGKAKGKKGRKARGGDSSDDGDGGAAATTTSNVAAGASTNADGDGDAEHGGGGGAGAGLSRKAKRLQKLKAKEEAAAKQHQQHDGEDDDDGDISQLLPPVSKDGGDEEEQPASSEEEEQPKKKLTKKQLKRQKEREAREAAAAKAALLEDEESKDDGDEEQPSSEEEQHLPKKKLTKKQLKRQKEREAQEAAAAKAALFQDEESSSEEDVEPDEHEEDDDDEEPAKKAMSAFDQLALDDSDDSEENRDHGDGDGDGEESSDEKEKKKKKKKKDKKKEKKDKDIDGDDSKEKKKKKKKKDKKDKKKEKKEASTDDEADDQEKEPDDEGSDDEDVFYGAPNEAAWTDKSHAILSAEEEAKKGPDTSLTHGPDGKKLSHRERKKAQKAREAALRAVEYEKTASRASAEGAQFACSQTAVSENDPLWQNSLDVSIPSFTISAAGKILFKEAEMMIAHGRRYGLVGPNGKGKSTLLKMIASGDLKLPPRIDFLYVEQEVVADDTPAVDAVLKADKRRWDLLEEEKVLTAAVDAGDEDPKKVERLQKVYDELNAIGAEASEAKARRILYGLGFDGKMQTKATKMFSGGWRMRISLARALFIEPTLLMLDEPTNHLDLNAVIWLDAYLQGWKKTLLIVSHDQDFLNSVCEEILHIEDLKLVSYKGDYDTFKRMERTKLKQQQKEWEKQEKRLRALKRSGQSRAKATENVKKNTKREPGARSQKKKQDAVAMGAETAEIKELIKRPREYTVKLEFAEVAELSRPVIQVSDVFFRYSPKHPVIFEKIDFGIDMDSRVCVVGPNGAGKSTLLKLLTGELKPTKGDVRRNPRLRMGIYNQHFVDRLPMDKTPVEHLRDSFQDEDYQSVRNRLGKYGLEGHAHEVTMRDLSGGQKARVVFVELSLQRPHVLLLDEPTNNLDIETIDALTDAINEFNGGIVVVTHDARLIEHCECTLWVVEKEGVTKWEEGFDDYKETILKELEEQSEKEAAARRAKLEAAAAARAEKLKRLARK